MATVRHELCPRERVTVLAADAQKIVPLMRAAGVTPRLGDPTTG